MNVGAFVFGPSSAGISSAFLRKTRRRGDVNKKLRPFSPSKKRGRANLLSRSQGPPDVENQDSSDSRPGSKLEPVEDGVELPPVKSRQDLDEETEWLETQLREWLDREWQQGEPQPIHAEIGLRTAQLYRRQRMEGENDLSSVLLAIGSELEGMDFTDAFVGPWNIANKTAEFLLEHRSGPRVKLTPFARDPNAPTWSREMLRKQKQEEIGQKVVKVGAQSPSAPSLADYFEKLKFLRDILDIEVSQELIDGAVAAAVGFRYDVISGTWDGSDVEEEYFKQFGNNPPNVLGDESVADYTETLKYLESQLAIDEEEGEVYEAEENEETESDEERLELIIETLHGTELAKIQMADKNNHSFHKRVVVVKWLHLRGGF